MKRRITMMIIFFVCVTVLYYQSIKPNPDDFTYPYHPKQDYEAWVKLHESSVRIDELLNIPENQLKKMTTPALLRVILDYPMITSSLLAYSSFQIGFDQFYSKFNGLRELMVREDAASVILEYYEHLDDSADNNVVYIFVEIFLMQDSILDQLDTDKLVGIVSDRVNHAVYIAPSQQFTLKLLSYIQ